MDSGPALSYTLHLDPNTQGMFGIHRYGGGVSLTGALDYEERTWYTLTVRSSDSKHQSEANLTVLVDDVNDNVPTFTQDLYQVQQSSQAHAPFTNWKVCKVIVVVLIRYINVPLLSSGDCIGAPTSRECSHHSNSH